MARTQRDMGMKPGGGAAGRQAGVSGKPVVIVGGPCTLTSGLVWGKVVAGLCTPAQPVSGGVDGSSQGGRYVRASLVTQSRYEKEGCRSERDIAKEWSWKARVR